jgi:hypothetical protein
LIAFCKDIGVIWDSRNFPPKKTLSKLNFKNCNPERSPIFTWNRIVFRKTDQAKA